jgi:GT2 family glycosyltransferase
MEKNKIDISLVMISYNTKKITLETLRSIYKHTKDVNFEIIISDHDSKDGSVKALQVFAKTKNNLKVLDTKRNPGFGAGNNFGAKIAKGEYLLFINTDILFKTNVIKKALTWLKNHPNIGAYSCKLLNKDLTVQATGGYFPTLFRVFAWQLFIDDLPIIKKLIKSIHPHKWFYKKSRDLDWVTGAFTIMPRKLFEDLGGFDENIWMYAEELELCYRVKKMGYSIAYQPEPSIIHLGGASSGGSRLGLTQEIKNLIYFFKKHKPKWQLPVIKLLIITGSILRYIIFGIIGNNETSRQAYSEGVKLAL